MSNLKNITLYSTFLFVITEITLGFRTNIAFFFFLLCCSFIGFMVKVNKITCWKYLLTILPTKLLLVTALSLFYIDNNSSRINPDMLFEMLLFMPIFYVFGLINSSRLLFLKTKVTNLVVAFSITIIFAGLISFMAMPYYLFHYYSQLSTTNYPKKTPTFVLKDLENKIYNSRELNEKVVLVDFFNTRCGFCVVQLDEMLELKKKFKDRKDFEILIISTGGVDSLLSINNFLSDSHNDMKYLKFVLDEDNNLWNQFNLKMTPTTCLINKNGELVYWQEGYFNGQDNYQQFMSMKIQQLLK